MDGVVEIITGRERRRRWSVEQKLSIIGETREAGARVRDVAARHDLCESVVFAWRRQAREGVLVARDAPTFLPVRMREATSPAVMGASSSMEASAAAPPAPPPPGLIEIVLGDGSLVRVGNDVAVATLRRVLAALRG